MKKLLGLLLFCVSMAAGAQQFDVDNLIIHGVGNAVTPAIGTSSTQLATTAFDAAGKTCLSIMDFGGNSLGLANNDTALDAAIAANPTGKICVKIPPGLFNFAANHVITLPAGGSLHIEGGGPDVTYLSWANNGGLSINVNGSLASVHIRDVSFLAGTTATGDAITLTQTVTTIGNPATTAPSDITNVTCRGVDGYVVSKYWSDCVTVHSVSNINFTNLFVAGPATAAGTGVQLVSTSTAPGVAYNFQGCTFDWNLFGILYGTYIQGVAVNQSNFTGGSTGIIAPAGATNLDQLTVTGSQFNENNTGIALQVNIPGTQIIGNLFGVLVSGGFGVNITGPGLVLIEGNNFGGNLIASTQGINFNGTSSSAATIVGNIFYRLPIAIVLGASTTGVNVQSNTYNGNTTNISNSGTNTIGGGSS